MNEKEIKELYEQKFIPFYEGRGKDRLRFNDKAESYFTELLKLLIPLSTAMIAFLSIAKDNIFKDLGQAWIIGSFVGYIITILLAIIAITLLAYFYKKYTDEAISDESRIYKKWKLGKYSEIKAEINKEEEEFANRKHGNWQRSTIICGVASFIFFVLSTCFVIILLFI